MTGPAVAAGLCGAGAGLGLTTAARAWRADRRATEGDPSRQAPGDRRRGSGPGGTDPSVLVELLRSRASRLVASFAVGAVFGALTGWPVAVVLGAVAAYGLPVLFGQTSAAVSIAKVEAVATWTEMLQGTLAASAGLGQSIVATAPLAPEVLRPAAGRLAARLTAGVTPRDALLGFADEVADPSADRVVCALLLAVSSRAQRMGELLAALAESTREEVALRLRIETSRASVRSAVRTVLVFSVGFAAALMLIAHAYLAPFGTPTGQVVLAAVGFLYAAGLVVMVALARPPAPVRLLGTAVEGR